MSQPAGRALDELGTAAASFARIQHSGRRNRQTRHRRRRLESIDEFPTVHTVPCVQCDTHGHEVEKPDEETPNTPGRTSNPSYTGRTATGCHTSESVAKCRGPAHKPKAKTPFKKNVVTQLTLGTNQGIRGVAEEIRTPAGKVDTAGQLSNPTGDPTIVGPTSAEQSGIPNEIKKARFLLYLVEHDGSYGIHNGDYARFLLAEAEELIQAAP